MTRKKPKRYEQGMLGHYHVYCKACGAFIGGSNTTSVDRWDCYKCGKKEVGSLKEVAKNG